MKVTIKIARGISNSAVINHFLKLINHLIKKLLINIIKLKKGIQQCFLPFTQNMSYFVFLKKSIRFKPGDLIGYNNRRVAHGRNAFDNKSGGTRFLQVSTR